MSDSSGAIVRTIVGPDGPIHLAATARGIVAVEQATGVEEFSALLAKRLQRPVDEEQHAPADDARHATLDRAERVVTELLAGGASAASASLPIDLADRPHWDQTVLAAVRDIPWGTTASYGEIARRIGAAGAARAVGGALGRNPITLLIPCHRVIAADGTIGGYGGDAWGSRERALERKRTLLRREGVIVPTRAG